MINENRNPNSRQEISSAVEQKLASLLVIVISFQQKVLTILSSRSKFLNQNSVGIVVFRRSPITS